MVTGIKIGDLPEISLGFFPDKPIHLFLVFVAIILTYMLGDYLWKEYGGGIVFCIVLLIIYTVVWLFGRIVTLDERNGYLLNEPADSVRDEVVSASPSIINPVHGRVWLGKSTTGENMYWEYMHPKLKNRHLTIIGGSGGGKTYLIQCVLDAIAKLRYQSVIIDYTDGFLPEQLEEDFISSVKPETHLLAVEPLAVNPFVKQERQIVKGGQPLVESDFAVATRICSVFTSVYSSLGEQQIALLIRAIEENLTENFSFQKLLKELRLNGIYKNGDVLAAKLEPFVKSKPFSDQGTGWNELLNGQNTQIIQLASLSRDVQRTIAEFTLWDLWDYAVANGNKNTPIPLVLDEVQNLDHKEGSPIDKILTEGRKFGLSAIQATQFLSRFSKSEKDRLFQAAHKLIFQPADTELADVAKMMKNIDPEGNDENHWKSELSGLGLGQCFSIGMSVNSGEPEARVVKINIAPFSAR